MWYTEISIDYDFVIRDYGELVLIIEESRQKSHNSTFNNIFPATLYNH